MEESRYWCPECLRWVLARRPRPNHLFHLLLSLLCLFWIGAWFLLSWFPGPFRCPRCGAIAQTCEGGPPAEGRTLTAPAIATVAVVAVGLPTVVLAVAWKLGYLETLAP